MNEIFKKTYLLIDRTFLMLILIVSNCILQLAFFIFKFIILLRWPVTAVICAYYLSKFLPS